MATDLSEQDVLALLERTGAIKRGHFVLSSGLHSDRYCQCAALFEHPADARRIGEAMASRLAGQVDAETVLAPALGGMLWGYELARAMGLRSLFAERKDGNFALRRGFAVRPSERILLAEDVVTTGGSVLELAALMERKGAEVAGVASVVDRSGGGFAERVGGRFSVHALVRLTIEVYPADEVPPELAALPVEDPGSRRSGR